MNRYVRPVMFAFEPDVVKVFAKVAFGATGAPTLDTSNSKGICNVTRSTVSFTANRTASSADLAAVSSYAGLYVGMAITGTGIPGGTTILSMNPGASTLTMSAQASSGTGTATTVTAAGGRFTFQFGTQAGVRLDTYNKLLMVKTIWDETGIPGTAAAAAGAGAVDKVFIVNNNISTRTIPNTAAANLTDATITLQFLAMSTSVGTFVAADPNSGDILRVGFELCRSGAI